MYHKIGEILIKVVSIFCSFEPEKKRKFEILSLAHTLRDVILQSYVLWFLFRIIWDKRNCNWLINNSSRWNISVTYEIFGVQLECWMQSSMTKYAVNPSIPMLRFPDFTRETLKRQYFHSYLRAGDFIEEGNSLRMKKQHSLLSSEKFNRGSKGMNSKTLKCKHWHSKYQ